MSPNHQSLDQRVVKVYPMGNREDEKQESSEEAYELMDQKPGILLVVGEKLKLFLTKTAMYPAKQNVNPKNINTTCN